MSKHKKSENCQHDLHEFKHNKCINCGDYESYLMADDSWFAGFWLFMSRPDKFRKK